MNKTFLILAFLLVSIVSKADFDADKLYLITSNDLKKGGIELATEGNYPLIYNVDATENTAKTLWTIKEEKPEKYSIRNSETGQYIQYAPNNSSGKFIKISKQFSGEANLFVIKNRKTENNITYWTISPVSNANAVFDRRKYNAVGPYQAQYTNNQLFSIKEKNGDYAKTPSLSDEPNKYMKSFTLDDVELIYDRTSKTYYCSIPIENMNSDLTKTVKFVSKNEDCKIIIGNKEIENGTKFTFTNITAQKAFKIQIKQNDKVLQNTQLIFTGLPIVQLYTEGNRLSSKFSHGKMKVTENNKTQTGELLNAEIRYRGATALSYSKKSFAIKLKNEAGKSTDRSYFGLRNDNYWILDAMAADLSRMRNRVCTDLWNDYSADPHFKNQEKNMINGTRGQFVEVFLDNQYWGLYCMTERLDRKQLKLNKYQKETKTIKGVLYKSEGWTNSVMMGKMRGGQEHSFIIPKYNNSTDKWNGYQMDYPDRGDGQLIDWKPLYNIVSFVTTSDNSTFKKQIGEKIDFPVWVDYYLFLELISARDNHGKNAFFYMFDITKDEKLGIAPWDLDGTWGRSWDRLKTSSKTAHLDFMKNHLAGEHHIYRRLRETDAENYNILLKKRYNELKNNHFSKQNLIKRLDDYLELFTISGAKAREETRWDKTNNVSIQIDEEIAYMKKWISERVDFLNTQYRN